MKFEGFLTSWRLLPTQILILISFALIPMWWKLPQAAPPFSAEYPLSFVLVLPMIGSIISWLLTGMPGLSRFCADRLRLGWLISLGVLLGWATLSQFWGFVASSQPGVSTGAALQLGIAISFVLVSSCAAPPTRVIMTVLILGLLVHGLIGAAQVWQQSSIGLGQFGEFLLNPLQSGISVIQAGDVRWLRPHGLLPHPNILAGFMMVALFGVCAWVWQARRSLPLALLCFVFGLWLLLLSFSRGAWLAFGLATLIVLPYLLRGPRDRKPLLFLSIAIALTGLIFFWQYQTLLLARAGAGTETTELRSIVDRAIFNGIAGVAIVEKPLLGIGYGQYPWYAADYLFNYTDFELRGTHVHNLYLAILAELGLVGALIVLVNFSLGLRASLDQCRGQPEVWRIACLAGFVGFMLIGFVDHYPWTMLGFQMLWLSLLGLAMRPQVLSAAAPGEPLPAAPLHNPHP